MRDGEHESQARLQQLAVDAAAREGVRCAATGAGALIFVDERPSMPAIALADASVLADLIIFSASAARDVFALGAHFAETLLDTSPPTLLVKDDQFGFGAVAIAWDGSAQAGRAVRGAMNSLRLAEEVVILQNRGDLNAPDPDPGKRRGA